MYPLEQEVTHVPKLHKKTAIFYPWGYRILVRRKTFSQKTIRGR